MAQDDALKRRLSGNKDSRGPQGIMSRGKNVYNGGTNAARSGGGANIGRPPTPGGGSAGGAMNANIGKPGVGSDAGVPSLSDIIQRMTNIAAPPVEKNAMNSTGQVAPGPPGIGGVGGGSPMPEMQGAPYMGEPQMSGGLPPEMGMQQQMPGGMMQPGQIPGPPPNALARRLGVM